MTSRADAAWYTLVVDDLRRIVIEHNFPACAWLVHGKDIDPADFATSLAGFIRQCIEHDAACFASQRMTPVA